MPKVWLETFFVMVYHLLWGKSRHFATGMHVISILFYFILCMITFQSIPKSHLFSFVWPQQLNSLWNTSFKSCIELSCALVKSYHTLGYPNKVNNISLNSLICLMSFCVSQNPLYFSNAVKWSN